MKKTVSLKKSKEFQRVLHKGKWFGGTLISMYILPNHFKLNNIGIAVGRKVGKANKRNRVKRVIRAAYQSLEMDIKTGYNIVFTWRTKADFKELSYNVIKRDMQRAFKKAEMLSE